MEVCLLDAFAMVALRVGQTKKTFLEELAKKQLAIVWNSEIS